MSSVQHTPPRAKEARREETASSAFFALACIGLGFLVVALAFFAALMWSDANGARNAADRCWSRHETMVWFSCTLTIVSLPSFTAA
jgi:hypothetical protein